MWTIDGALTDYDKALDLNPSYVMSVDQRYYSDLGQYDQAIENLTLRDARPTKRSHLRGTRPAYHLWGDWNCAISDYRRALTQLPLGKF